MTWMEFFLALVALAAVATAIATIVLVRRLLPLIRRTDELARNANATVVRLEGVTREAEAMVHGARSVESRVTSTVHGLLDQVEPPLRTLGSLVAAVRAGAAVWLNARGRPSDQTVNGEPHRGAGAPARSES